MSALWPGKYWSHSAQIATALCKGTQGRRRQRKTHIWCRRLTTTQVTNGSGKVLRPRPATQKISSSGKYFWERKTEVFLFLLSLKLFLPSLAQLATQELWAFPRKQSLWLPTARLLGNLFFWYFKFFPGISRLCEIFELLQNCPYVGNLWNSPDISIHAISIWNLSIFLRGDLTFGKIAKVLEAIHKGTNSELFDLCQRLWTEEY